MIIIKVISLFDGISCGMLALKRANINVSEYIAYEIDKYAIEISKNNFPNIKHMGNVINADFSLYKGFDLLIGGSPCQDLSIAKTNRQGLLGSRSSLFFEYVKALNEIKPKYFLFENVASMSKKNKDIISNCLGVQPIMINSALVSAQQRKRLYWTNIPNITQPKDKKIILTDILESGLPYQDKSYCITARYQGCCFNHDYPKRKNSMVCMPIRLGAIDNKKSQGNRVYSVKGKSICLSANGGGLGAKTGLYKIDLPDGDYYIRKLTPIECERLQTLPDNYTRGISDTQRYKCIGNGWTVDVIAHILKNIK